MTGELVLITGATGHVGFRVLRYALEFGYKVRAAVRSEAKAEAVRSNSALKALNKDDHLSFIIVPDIVAADAYDDAVKDVLYVIHVASPIRASDPDGDLEKEMVQPAIQGTINMLEAARQSRSVKRIVITSSAAAITPPEAWSGEPVARITPESRVPNPTGPYTATGAAYIASKIIALNSAEAWMQKEKPGFDLIHIHPTFVEGRNDLTSTVDEIVSSGTNAMILKPALGQKTDPQFIVTNYLDDTAWVHVKALDPRVAGNQSFLTTNPGDEGTQWNDVKEIVAKHFPEAVREGILPNNGDTPSMIILQDASKTEKTFGFQFASFETQVVSVVGHYLELYRKERRGPKT